MNFRNCRSCYTVYSWIQRLLCIINLECHGRMARGGHGLPEVCPGLTLPRPMGRPPLKQPYGRSSGGQPTGHAACGRLLPTWIPHAVRLCHLRLFIYDSTHKSSPSLIPSFCKDLNDLMMMMMMMMIKINVVKS
jgi:hypothetical protein